MSRLLTYPVRIPQVVQGIGRLASAKLSIQSTGPVGTEQSMNYVDLEVQDGHILNQETDITVVEGSSVIVYVLGTDVDGHTDRSQAAPFVALEQFPVKFDGPPLIGDPVANVDEPEDAGDAPADTGSSPSTDAPPNDPAAASQSGSDPAPSGSGAGGEAASTAEPGSGSDPATPPAQPAS